MRAPSGLEHTPCCHRSDLFSITVAIPATLRLHHITCLHHEMSLCGRRPRADMFQITCETTTPASSKGHHNLENEPGHHRRIPMTDTPSTRSEHTLVYGTSVACLKSMKSMAIIDGCRGQFQMLVFSPTRNCSLRRYHSFKFFTIILM